MVNINTERLTLRNWTLSDAPDLYDYAKNELVGPNAGWKPHKSLSESESIIKMFIDSKDEIFAIVLKEENKVIGSIGLHNKIPHKSLNSLSQREIGYVLNPKYWGNEFIKEAVESLIQYSFNSLNIDVLWCGHYDFNSRSKRICEKCGFKYQFTREETLLALDNKEVNVLYYNLFNPNFLNKS